MYRIRKVPFEGIDLTGTLFYFEQCLLNHFMAMTFEEVEHILFDLLRSKRVTCTNTRVFEIYNNVGETVRTYDAFQVVKLYNDKITTEIKGNPNEANSSGSSV